MGAIAPSSGLEFKVSLDVRRDQQPHHDTRIEAHLRVKAAGTGPHDEVPAVELAVVIALDVAAGRRESAAAALAATLRALPDGVSFAVLGGADESGEPSRCYPLRGRWALADTMEKRRAAFSAGRIVPAADDRPPPGYPAWLTAARALFAERPLPLRHLLLITDGSGRDPADEAGPDGDGGALGDELATCDGVFTADVLAVGGDWDPAPLLAVVERLHGTAEHAPDRFGPAVTGALRRLRRVRSPELPVVVTARPAVRAVELTETAPRQQRLTPATGQGSRTGSASPPTSGSPAPATTSSPCTPTRAPTRSACCCNWPPSPSGTPPPRCWSAGCRPESPWARGPPEAGAARSRR